MPSCEKTAVDMQVWGHPGQQPLQLGGGTECVGSPNHSKLGVISVGTSAWEETS